MNTESRRKASATFHAKREAAGLKKVTLWLSPEARAALDALAKVYGSKDKAAEAKILAADIAKVAKAVPRAVKSATTPAVRVSVPFGPQPVAPGQRQKKR